MYCRVTIGPRVAESDFEFLGQSWGTVYVAIYGEPRSTETSDAAMLTWYAIDNESGHRPKPKIHGVWKHSNETNKFTLKIGDEFVETID